MNAKVLSLVSMGLGAIGVLAELANIFPAKCGATGILGAILFAGGLISVAIVQTRPQG